MVLTNCRLCLLRARGLRSFENYSPPEDGLNYSLNHSKNFNELPSVLGFSRGVTGFLPLSSVHLSGLNIWMGIYIVFGLIRRKYKYNRSGYGSIQPGGFPYGNCMAVREVFPEFT